MPAEVFGHEAGNKVVAMIVAGLEPERVRDFGFDASSLEQLRAKLLNQKRVGSAAVDQEV